MSEKKATYYGQVELIPGIICDGYVLHDGTACLSERGTADLLGIDQKALNRVRTTGIPKTLEPFIDKGLIVRTTPVEVVAQNSPHKGRYIEVYCSSTVESIMRAYVLALAHRKLQKNQKHVGEQCAILQCSLVRTALDVAIKEACGFIPNIQKIAQNYYLDAVGLLQDSGFTCSLPNHIATTKDITNFLKVPRTTLNNFLRHHKDGIKPIQLQPSEILTVSNKARKMNGYILDDVARIVVGMDTEVGLCFKKKLLGPIVSFANLCPKGEIEWREFFSKIFAGLGLRYNYAIGKYRVDFFVSAMGLCLECNGYDLHRNYDPKEEEEREKFIANRYSLVRFHHKVKLEVLINAILQHKRGKVIKLYEPEHITLAQ